MAWRRVIYHQAAYDFFMKSKSSVTSYVKDLNGLGESYGVDRLFVFGSRKGRAIS